MESRMDTPEQEIIAAFDDIGHAIKAQNLLRGKGIVSTIVDDQRVTADWMTHATAAYKVQVATKNADAAAELIMDRMGDVAIFMNSEIDEAELERQAMAEPPEDDV